MNERTTWIVRLIAIVVFLLLAYLMLSLYSKLTAMKAQGRAALDVPSAIERSRIADRGLRITETRQSNGA